MSGAWTYVLGNPFCGLCTYAMRGEINVVAEVWCVNERCSRHNTRYLVPRIWLEEASPQVQKPVSTPPVRSIEPNPDHGKGGVGELDTAR